MDAGKFFAESEKYVSEICGAFIAPNTELESIECRHKGSEGLAFIKVVDCTGHSEYYDISGYTLEQIGYLVARVVVDDDVPERLVTRDARKEVAKLFN